MDELRPGEVSGAAPGAPEISPPAKVSQAGGGGNLKEGGGGSKSLDVSSKPSLPLNLASGSGVKRGAGLAPRQRGFDWQRKRRFLRYAKRFWPNVSKCCLAAGISTQTYYSHMKTDKVFALKVAQVDQATTDEIEGVLASQATEPKSFLDRMAYLRAHRPELYDRAKVIKVEGYKAPNDSEAERRRRLLAGAVDAEIVKNYEDRRERRKTNYLTEGSGGSEAGGGKTGGGA